jgi:hypothetical protein
MSELFPTNARFDIHPLMSAEQRKFVDGDISADAFLSAAHKAAEQRASEDLALSRLHDGRIGATLFGAVGSLVYVGASVVLLFTGRRSPAFVSIMLAVVLSVFTVVMIVLGRSTLRRRWAPYQATPSPDR